MCWHDRQMIEGSSLDIPQHILQESSYRRCLRMPPELSDEIPEIITPAIALQTSDS